MATQESTDTPQSWLTLKEICQRLNISMAQALPLVKSGKLVGIKYASGTGFQQGWRYLDPTPKYARALEVQCMILSKHYTVDVTTIPLLSVAEVAAILDVSNSRVRQLVMDKKLSYTKIGHLNLFTAVSVREYLWKREKAQRTDRRARTGQMVKWFLAYYAKENAQKMTKAEVAEDDNLERVFKKLLRLPEPERSKAVKEFWNRADLAKQVAPLIAKETEQANKKPPTG